LAVEEEEEDAYHQPLLLIAGGSTSTRVEMEDSKNEVVEEYKNEDKEWNSSGFVLLYNSRRVM
jgi:hypothetical protein